MLIAIVQTVLAAVACGLLFAGWRRFRPHGTVALFVAAGLVIRAVAGQVVFWISYLELAVVRGLHVGRGFWFYAHDGVKYFDTVAREAHQKGVAAAIFSLDAYGVSPGFRKILAVMDILFGHVPSTALLLNLACYLGTCAIVVALAGERKRVATIAVAGISLSPSLVLWSTQLLKDVLFVFLIAMFVAAVAYWIGAWNRETNVRGRAVLATSALLAALGAIASVRWYFALMLLVVSLPLLMVVAFRSRTPLRALALLFGMCGLIVAGALIFARPHFGPEMMAMITSTGSDDPVRLPQLITDVVNGARAAYERLPGSTVIRVGPALSELSSPRLAQFISSGTALLLPRPLANATGLVEMHGGRGLWLFADADTLLFDVFLIIALAALLRAPRAPNWRNPLLWLVLIFTVVTAVAFVYTVNNFGALFRYRSMVFVGVVLIPVAARSETCRRWSGRESQLRVTDPVP